MLHFSEVAKIHSNFSILKKETHHFALMPIWPLKQEYDLKPKVPKQMA